MAHVQYSNIVPMNRVMISGIGRIMIGQTAQVRLQSVGRPFASGETKADGLYYLFIIITRYLKQSLKNKEIKIRGQRRRWHKEWKKKK